VTTRILLSRGQSIGAGEAVRQMRREGRLDNEIHFLRGGLISIAVRVDRPEMVSMLLDLGLDPDETVRGEDVSRMSWGMPLWFTAMAAYSVVSALRDLEEHEPTLAHGRPCRSRCRRRESSSNCGWRATTDAPNEPTDCGADQEHVARRLRSGNESKCSGVVPVCWPAIDSRWIRKASRWGISSRADERNRAATTTLCARGVKDRRDVTFVVVCVIEGHDAV